MTVNKYLILLSRYKKLYWVKGIPWEMNNGFLQSQAPPQVGVELTKDEADHLLKLSGANFIRWTDKFDCETESPWWYVIKDGISSLEELSKNTRNQTKRGLSCCGVKRIKAEYLAEYGYAVYRNAFMKYVTKIQIDPENVFIESIMRDKYFPELIEYYGVFYNDKLVGYSKNYIQDDVVLYSTIKYDPNYLKYYSGYVLISEMNKHYLNERKMRFVYDGMRSIYHESNIQEFLISKFKFRRAYCRLNIAYSPGFGIAVKMFYPFKIYIKLLTKTINLPIFEKAGVVLIQEQIKRDCDKAFNKIRERNF